MSALLLNAEAIAREAHAGQFYDVRDYVDGHVAPVAGLIAKLGYGEDFQATGWIHDVLEDSELTADDLLERDIPLRIVTAAELLTKKGEPHEVYMGKIATDGLATVGKYADSSVNFANTVMRAERIDDEKFRRWMKTYTSNLAFLLPLLPSLGN